LRFILKISGYKRTSTRSSIVNTALTKSAVVKFLHLIGCIDNVIVSNGLRIKIFKILMLNPFSRWTGILQIFCVIQIF